jgi:hypothetical protein
MKYKFGDVVKTTTGAIGIVVQVQTLMEQYFVMFPNGGRLFFEIELEKVADSNVK